LLDCEEIIVSGKKDVFVSKILAKRRMGQGSSLKGPKYIFRADLLVKRILRGMLPWDRAKGKEAHKRLKCHIGNGDLKEDLLKDVKTVEHKKPRNYFTIKEVIRRLK
jgi:large subunit ribosomal protein L13